MNGIEGQMYKRMDEWKDKYIDGQWTNNKQWTVSGLKTDETG